MRDDELISIGRRTGQITIGKDLIDEFGYDDYDRASLVADKDADLIFITFGEGEASVRKARSNLFIAGKGIIHEAGRKPPEEATWPEYIATDNMIRLDVEELPSRARIEAE